MLTHLCRQNLARERAKAFGKKDASQSNLRPESNERPHLLHTPYSSVVVTTTASDELRESEQTPNVLSPEEDEELRMKPRGFFADQFEVGQRI